VSVITFDHATLHIGGRSVLSEISFDIEAGEFIGLLGPNGAGKTTLMRAILGLLTPAAAVLSFRASAGARKSGNGYFPQLRTARSSCARARPSQARSMGAGAAFLSHKERIAVEALESVGARDLAARPLSGNPAASGKGCCWRRR
jgi:zinc/manganese transport system ATP-binding protein